MCESVRIIVMAKTPLPGVVKTRLIPALGAQAAADLAEKLFYFTLRQARRVCFDPAYVGRGERWLEICVAPDCRHVFWQRLQQRVAIQITQQQDGDLGARLWAAAQRVAQPVLLMGTDCPGMTTAYLQQAVQALKTHDAVLCPAEDGGYVALGVRRPDPVLFTDIPWSSDQVAAVTRERLRQLGYSVLELPSLSDIDEPNDVLHHEVFLCKLPSTL